MLNISSLSFWEKNTFFEGLDFLVIGAGIVGCSTAFHLRKKYPNAKILVLERGFLPMGASTKNAGFACFGGVTELIDDLGHIPEHEVWQTVQKRWDGLNYLKEIIGEKHLDLLNYGSWDLIDAHTDASPYRDKLDYLNTNIEIITGKKNVYSEDASAPASFGFSGIPTSFNNMLEGQIDTGKMMLRYHQLLVEQGILLIQGIEVFSLENTGNKALLNSSIGEIAANQVVICVNGFANQFLGNQEVKPARAQVLITKPIENLKIRGTFHYQMGYYYFRNIGKRVLFGGGRNLDFEGETTEKFGNTEQIIEDLTHKLKTHFLPDTAFEIDYCWSGIMGVGKAKSPIVKRLNPNVVVGVRMGGMGVAIGSLIGKEAADLC